MRWKLSYTRGMLIAIALSVAAAGAVYLIRSAPPTSIGCSPRDDPRSYPFQTWVTLTFKEFHPAGNTFTGALSMEIAPNPDFPRDEDAGSWMKDLKTVVLRFEHFEANSFVFQGGADGPINLTHPAAWGSLQGNATFSWSAQPSTGSFYYPFDRYVLRVNPSLLEVRDADSYPVDPIDVLTTDFGNSNFVPHLARLNAHAPNDLYEIVVQRPLLLRVITIIVGLLLIIWLAYLIFSAKTQEYVGQVVTLFVGVFSIRSSLLSGAPVFPSFIDYFALGIYLSAVLVVLIKWMFPDRKTKECEFCRSSIPLGASVCLYCTKPVKAEEVAVVNVSP